VGGENDLSYKFEKVELWQAYQHEIRELLARVFASPLARLIAVSGPRFARRRPRPGCSLCRRLVSRSGLTRFSPVGACPRPGRGRAASWRSAASGVVGSWPVRPRAFPDTQALRPSSRRKRSLSLDDRLASASTFLASRPAKQTILGLLGHNGRLMPRAGARKARRSLRVVPGRRKIIGLGRRRRKSFARGERGGAGKVWDLVRWWREG